MTAGSSSGWTIEPYGMSKYKLLFAVADEAVWCKNSKKAAYLLR